LAEPHLEKSKEILLFVNIDNNGYSFSGEKVMYKNFLTPDNRFVYMKTKGESFETTKNLMQIFSILDKYSAYSSNDCFEFSCV
jgi:hypothetical protein